MRRSGFLGGTTMGPGFYIIVVLIVVLLVAGFVSAARRRAARERLRNIDPPTST
jgi:hypothetical protein